jgi:CheY-like chemotaxis protein
MTKPRNRTGLAGVVLAGVVYLAFAQNVFQVQGVVQEGFMISQAGYGVDGDMIKVRGSVRALLGTKKPVAIVEDDRDDRVQIGENLHFLLGETPVLSFSGGGALIEYLARNPSDDARPGLILLDLHLAKLDGLQLLEFLHTRKELADIPVIVISGTQDSQKVRDAFAHGARAFLPKPLSRWDLAHILTGRG